MKEKSGIGICGVLFLIFLVLKLAEVGAVANWSWWWVTSPLWLPIAAVLIALAFFGILVVGLAVVVGDRDKRLQKEVEDVMDGDQKEK